MAQYNYSAQRERYLPRTDVKVLFVGESAPDPNASEVRFFYCPVLSRADNLFRGMMLALYWADKHELDRKSKEQWLETFQSDGYYLEDLCALPVNRLPAAQRSQARRAAVSGLLRRIETMSPAGIIICHGATYADIADRLRENRLPVLHDEPIPFPLGNCRVRFAEEVRMALSKLY